MTSLTDGMKPSTNKGLGFIVASEVNKEAQFSAEMDSLGRLIFQQNLRIQNLYFDIEMNLMLILLNSEKVIKRHISEFERLADASYEQLSNFENNGVGIHWPDLDEDLSLKGFLEYEIIHTDKPLTA